MHSTEGTALIQIGGKQRPIFFGFLQSRIFCKKEWIENQTERERQRVEYWNYLDEVNKAFGLKDNPIPEGLTEEERTHHIVRRMDMFIMADLLYSALVAGCKHPHYRQQQDFTNDDVFFWIEKMSPEEMGKVYATMLEANKSPNTDKDPNAETQAAAQPEAASA